MKITALILAGGKGERFWPRSRKNCPKQFLSLTGDGRTMIVSSHLVDELETMIDDAVFIKDGALVLWGDAKALREKHGMSIVDMYMKIYGEGASFNA